MMGAYEDCIADGIGLLPDEPYSAPGSALAKARVKAHRAFDPIWQSGAMSRSDAYRWLAAQLGIPFNDCHMVKMDEATCGRVVEVCLLREAGE